MGKLNEVVVQEQEAEKPAEVPAESNVKVGEELTNCGVKDGCGPEAFAVHVFTGMGNSQGPKICIGGK